MKRPTDTFVFPHELGQRLRDLRLKAGLTQPGLAQAMGRIGKGRACIVSRIERGSVRFPSLGLVADFLRGCRAGFADITDILDLYTDLPTAQQKVFHRELVSIAAKLPAKWQEQVTDYDLRFDVPKARAKSQPAPTIPDRLKRLERARKLAAGARRRFFYNQFLSKAVNDTGLDPVLTVTEPLFKHGLEWFGILYRTRKAKPGVRERQLAESEAEFAKASRFPLDAIRKLEDGVRRRFGMLEMSGELDWLPNLSLEEYEAGLLAPTRKRTLKQELLDQFRHELEEYEAARKAAVERVWAEVQPMLNAVGVPQERRPGYRRLAGVCFTAATGFEPGSAGEKAQLDEYILNPQWVGLGLDTALAQKLAGIVLTRFRELAKSLPPDPRPKR